MDTGGNSLPSPSCPDATKRRVCYYYDSGIAKVDFGEHHVMVPRRVDMAHALVRSYGLLGHMRRLRTTPATEDEIAAFHEPGYVELLRDLTPEGFNAGGKMAATARAYAIGYEYDNPAIAGLWEYCQRYTGGSLAAARALASQEADVAINWSGGMHHACRGCASGFCFVNDIVLAVNDLLAHFSRVLYVDIDVHHGDGVEAAFVDSNRVMTVSFHQRTNGFFPLGTGNLHDVGTGKGKFHAVNVPMFEDMDDEGYHQLFKPVVAKAMEVFQPEAVVMQCGGDSLYGDRLGRLNLSIAGHAQCVSYMRSFNVPLLLLGGGGYTINHVAACWCYETAVAVGKEKEIDNDIPNHWYDSYYSSQDYKLHYPVDKRRKNKNKNTSIYIRDTAKAVIQNLSAIKKGEPILQFESPRGGSTDDTEEALFHSSPPREYDDPMERLHRRCGRMDMHCFFVQLGKQQHKLKLADEGMENSGGHQTSQSEPVPVKKPRHGKLYFKANY